MAAIQQNSIGYFMQNWINRQTELNGSRFDKAIETQYPEGSVFFKDANQYHRGITTLWNYLDASKMVDWDTHIPPNAVVLDLAGGPGWLSAYLSAHKNVSNIYNLDSSNYFLSKLMPELIELMGGKQEKIEPIEGLFSPLLFEDNSIDMVVVSSSLHHAENMEYVLKDIYRVLKPGASLVILNETPLGYWSYMALSVKLYLITLKDMLLRKYKSVSPKISSGGVLYDPYLNDTYYPLWYWEKAIKVAGFTLAETMNTGLLTSKSDSKGVELVNFICKKP